MRVIWDQSVFHCIQVSYYILNSYDIEAMFMGLLGMSILPSRQEPGSPTAETFNSTEGSQDGDFVSEILSDPTSTAAGNGNVVSKLPLPDPWPQDPSSRDLRIPEPLPHPPNRLNEINVRKYQSCQDPY